MLVKILDNLNVLWTWSYFFHSWYTIEKIGIDTAVENFENYLCRDIHNPLEYSKICWMHKRHFWGTQRRRHFTAISLLFNFWVSVTPFLHPILLWCIEWNILHPILENHFNTMSPNTLWHSNLIARRFLELRTTYVLNINGNPRTPQIATLLL